MYKAKKHCPEINPLWTGNPKKGTLAKSEGLDEMPNCEDPGLFWRPPACAPSNSSQRLYYSFSGKYHHSPCLT